MPCVLCRNSGPNCKLGCPNYSTRVHRCSVCHTEGHNKNNKHFHPDPVPEPEPEIRVWFCPHCKKEFQRMILSIQHRRRCEAS